MNDHIAWTQEALDAHNAAKAKTAARRVRADQERRRSNAAGFHGHGGRKQLTRAAAKAAIRREVWA